MLRKTSRQRQSCFMMPKAPKSTATVLDLSHVAVQHTWVYFSFRLCGAQGTKPTPAMNKAGAETQEGTDDAAKSCFLDRLPVMFLRMSLGRPVHKRHAAVAFLCALVICPRSLDRKWAN